MNGTTPLFWACKKGLNAVAMKLLELGGVNVDAIDWFDGTNVIWEAFNSGLHEVVIKLLGMGATPSAIDRDTLFFVAQRAHAAQRAQCGLECTSQPTTTNHPPYYSRVLQCRSMQDAATHKIDPCLRRLIDGGSLTSILCEQCAICCSEFTTDTLVSSISRLECGHIFHQQCIGKWEDFCSPLYCPLCRKDCSDQGIGHSPLRRTNKGGKTTFSLYPKVRL